MSESPENPVVEMPQDSLSEQDPIDLLIEVLSTQSHTTKLREIKLKIDNDQFSHKLIELTSTQRGDYMQWQVGRANINAKGEFTGMKDVRGLEDELVSMSLRTLDGKPVPKSVIGEYPSGLVSNMAKVIRRISGLDQGAEQAAKKL